MMQFEPSAASEMLGPLLTEQALSDYPIFGPDKANIEETADAAVKSAPQASELVGHANGYSKSLPASFHEASGIAAKLRIIRAFIQENNATDEASSKPHNSNSLQAKTADMSLASNGLGSCRDIHESLLTTLATTSGLPPEAQSVIDHAMLFRAKEKYLFDSATNRDVVSDDPWLRFLWDWIAGLLSWPHLSPTYAHI